MVFQHCLDMSRWVYRIVGRADKIDDEIKKIMSLRDKANRDSLTGLLNQDCIMKSIKHNLEVCGCGIGFMIDIDDFKGVNDRHGHLVGNNMLKCIANVLTDNFRQEDIIGRFGGDEFFVFIPNTSDVVWARSKAKKIVEAINSIKVSDNEFLRASVGVAINKDGTLSLDQMLKKADEAMYKAKELGKNMFKMY